MPHVAFQSEAAFGAVGQDPPQRQRPSPRGAAAPATGQAPRQPPAWPRGFCG